MKVTPCDVPDILIFEPKIFGDQRGFFFESFNTRVFESYVPGSPPFVQDNHSKSARGVLRGIHYQIQHPQGKLVRVTSGEVLDVAVDLRRSSRYFGRHVAVTLSEENKKQLWIPPGFGHGFLVLSESAEFLYKTTDFWYPEHERTLAWNDATLAIDWPDVAPKLSAKDALGLSLSTAETFA